MCLLVCYIVSDVFATHAQAAAQAQADPAAD